jgi:hypothetical protein
MAVTDSDVEGVLPDGTEITDFSQYINIAGRYYDNLLPSGNNVSTDVRDDVVTFLAAYYVASGKERQISSAGEGGGNVSYEGDYDQNSYWELAKTTDPTGLIASSGKPSADLTVPDVKQTD